MDKFVGLCYNWFRDLSLLFQSAIKGLFAKAPDYFRLEALKDLRFTTAFGHSLIYGLLIFSVFTILNYQKIINKLIIYRWMRKLAIKQHETVFKQIFKDADGFALSKISRKLSDAPEYTYGEILFVPFIALLSQTNINKHTIFYDLGSGVGKAVIACSMVFKIQKSCGIELFTNLHACANSQKTKLYAYSQYKSNPINFINANFLEIDFSEASLIFINATAFIGAIWDDLNKKLGKIQKNLTIISISKKINATNFKISKTTYVEMSWGIALAYIYTNL